MVFLANEFPSTMKPFLLDKQNRIDKRIFSISSNNQILQYFSISLKKENKEIVLCRFELNNKMHCHFVENE